jgi:Ca-activated chloride channel family protein
MKRITTFLLFALLILLTGCNADEPKETGIVPGETIKNDDKEPIEKETDLQEDGTEKNTDVESRPLPTTLNELALLTPGYTERLSTIDENDQKVILKLTKDLPDISNGASEKELDNYYNQLLEIFQRDFKGPEDIIDKLKFQTIGNPEIEDPRKQFKENLNVMVILDASGSMGKKIGSQTQLLICHILL